MNGMGGLRDFEIFPGRDRRSSRDSQPQLVRFDVATAQCAKFEFRW
jgi:hypothetical protein